MCHLHSPGNGHICLSVLAQLLCISQVSEYVPVSLHTHTHTHVFFLLQEWGGIEGNVIGNVKVRGDLCIITKIGPVLQK